MKSGIALSLALAVSGAAVAAPPADLSEKASAYLDVAIAANGPGVSAIIVDDGKIIYHDARGLADVDSGRPLTADSVFRIGSITKQFAAAMVMRLVDEGKVSLDDPLGKYVADFPNGETITVRQLLNHTSGIRSYTSQAQMMVEAKVNRQLTTAQMIDEFEGLEPDFEPGTQWLYNNSGYVLVGAVIESVTGKAWHQAIEEQLLAPNGIEGIGYMGSEGSDPALVQGYTDFAGNVVRAQKIDGSVPHAAGALKGDLASLARWYAALFGGDIVSAQSLEAMTSPTVTADGETSPYGFGLQVGEIQGRKRIGHSGGIFGFTSDSAYLPEEDLFVAVFANSDSPAVGPAAVTERLVTLALGKDVPLLTTVELDEDALEGVLGRYDYGEFHRDLYLRDGKFYSRRKDNAEVEVFQAGEDLYYFGPQSMSYFHVDRSGEVPTIRFYAGGEDESETGTFVGEVPEEANIALSDEQRARLVGIYDFPFGAFTIAEDGSGGLTAQLEGQPSIGVVARSESELFAPQVGARMVFTIEGDTASAVTLFQGGQEVTAPRRD